MKILIAEDNLAAQAMLETALTELGHEVTATDDGSAACEAMLKPDAPKLAVLDWMLPGMDGVEICRTIREKKLTDPAYLIILTVRNRTEDIIKGLKAGANDYIVKPYKIEELKVRVGVGCRILEMQNTMARQIKELQNAMGHIKILRGLLPMCAYCKKIRNSNEYWQQVEGYIAEHSEAHFSHGICPECYQKHIQPQLDKIEKRN